MIVSEKDLRSHFEQVKDNVVREAITGFTGGGSR